MSPPPNSAAWQMGPKIKPLEIKLAPYTPPGDDEIVIKNGAVAINPLDYTKQDMSDLLYAWINYLFVFGSYVSF